MPSGWECRQDYCSGRGCGAARHSAAGLDRPTLGKGMGHTTEMPITPPGGHLIPIAWQEKGQHSSWGQALPSRYPELSQENGARKLINHLWFVGGLLAEGEEWGVTVIG